MSVKKLKFPKKQEFYILAPTSASTGGPDVYIIRFSHKKYFKIKTIMVYLPLNIDKPVHKNYHHFNLEHEIFIEDNEENILIIPEHFSFLKHSLQYKNIKKNYMVVEFR